MLTLRFQVIYKRKKSIHSAFPASLLDLVLPPSEEKSPNKKSGNILERFGWCFALQGKKQPASERGFSLNQKQNTTQAPIKI